MGPVNLPITGVLITVVTKVIDSVLKHCCCFFNRRGTKLQKRFETICRRVNSSNGIRMAAGSDRSDESIDLQCGFPIYQTSEVFKTLEVFADAKI